MVIIHSRWRYIVVALVLAGFMFIGSNKAAEEATGHPNPATTVVYPKDMKWSGSPTTGAQTVTLYGDPNKPGGLYIELLTWHPHSMSRPHFHPNDRFITVMSGTWWKGQGTQYDPDSTIPIPAGSFATDLANGIHFDGAKDADVTLELVGFGPASSKSAEGLTAQQASGHPNPATTVLLPQDMKWSGSPTSGAQSVVLYGDPNKPGLYIELTKWHAHNMSHPHFHPNDRFITVISGTWWKGQDTKYDPDSTIPIPQGSFATDLARGIHYDGAKDADVTIEIVGMGPATNTPAEVK